MKGSFDELICELGTILALQTWYPDSSHFIIHLNDFPTRENPWANRVIGATSWKKVDDQLEVSSNRTDEE